LILRLGQWTMQEKSKKVFFIEGGVGVANRDVQ
jgi:molybdopterin biosynthesis enzyme MoaB